MKSLWVVALLGLLAALVPIAYYLGLLTSATTHRPALEFVSAEWKGSERVRPQMIDDLLESGVLIGLARDDVRELLGEPGPYSTPPDRWAYFVSPAGIDSWWLAVRFEKDEVVSARLETD